jgi:hypothetical protein
MPSVIDTPEIVTSVETDDLTIEPRERRALVQRMMTSRIPARRARGAPAFETALDRFVQESPSLALYIFVHI